MYDILQALVAKYQGYKDLKVWMDFLPFDFNLNQWVIFADQT